MSRRRVQPDGESEVNRSPQPDGEDTAGATEEPTSMRVPSPHPGETSEQRAARVSALRKLWLEGRLDLTVPDDPVGLDRLIDDLLDDGAPAAQRTYRN